MTTTWLSEEKRRAAQCERCEDGRYMALSIHRLIQDLLGAGHRNPTPDVLIEYAGRHPSNQLATTYRRMATVRLLTGGAQYFRHFVPSASWQLSGVEVRGRKVRFDLVWEGPQGIICDEMKVGTSAAALDYALVQEQVERQVRAGTVKWGGRFRGVRACLLAEPAHSFLLTPTGARLPYGEAEFHV
jgi:hypothetical protein